MFLKFPAFVTWMNIMPATESAHINVLHCRRIINLLWKGMSFLRKKRGCFVTEATFSEKNEQFQFWQVLLPLQTKLSYFRKKQAIFQC